MELTADRQHEGPVALAHRNIEVLGLVPRYMEALPCPGVGLITPARARGDVGAPSLSGTCRIYRSSPETSGSGQRFQSWSSAARRPTETMRWSVRSRGFGCPTTASRTSASVTAIGPRSTRVRSWYATAVRVRDRDRVGVHDRGRVEPVVVGGDLEQNVTPLESPAAAAAGGVEAKPFELVLRRRPRRRGAAAGVGRPLLLFGGAGLVVDDVPQEHPNYRGGQEIGFGAHPAT